MTEKQTAGTMDGDNETLWIAEWGVHAFQFVSREKAEAWLNEGCTCGRNHGGTIYDLNKEASA